MSGHLLIQTPPPGPVLKEGDAEGLLCGLSSLRLIVCPPYVHRGTGDSGLTWVLTVSPHTSQHPMWTLLPT